ncbi:MAG TPA: hypothetical protein VG917_01590 [Patescibacteria group bacterium]|nr:hypothetical protein [Patescibacteria group bacterium]
MNELLNYASKVANEGLTGIPEQRSSDFDPEYYMELKARIALAMKSNGRPVFLYDNDPRRSGTYLNQAGDIRIVQQEKMAIIGDVVRHEYGCSEDFNASGPFYSKLNIPKDLPTKYRRVTHGQDQIDTPAWKEPRKKNKSGLDIVETWHHSNVDGLYFIKREYTINLATINEDGTEEETYVNVESYYARGPQTELPTKS